MSYVNKIEVKKLRHLEDISIEVGGKNLIITGSNGSGKTSFMEKLNIFFSNRQGYILAGNDAIVDLSDPNIIDKLYTYLPALRQNQFNEPRKIERVYLSHNIKYTDFLKYMVILRHDMLEANFSGDRDAGNDLQTWFDRFENTLKEVFNDDTLKLIYTAKELSFKIKLNGRDPVIFNQLSHGYSSFLKIVMEIIIKMEAKNSKDYNLPGIVLIDEVEIHLHIEMQKKIMPFLTQMFPNIQFIVTTHSPFVINSLSNAVIYDLEKQQTFENLSAYSYEGVIEYYYGVQQYSKEAIQKFEDYKSLVEKEELIGDDEERLIEALRFLKSIPLNVAPEIVVQFRTMERKRAEGKRYG